MHEIMFIHRVFYVNIECSFSYSYFFLFFILLKHFALLYRANNANRQIVKLFFDVRKIIFNMFL